jgi:DNA-binding transcriptional MerR regulator
MSKKEFELDYMTIKEFAELSGTTVPSLRHYDKIGVFVPAKRGIEFENKYRYYSPTQITAVKMIRVLVEIGVPLKMIKDLEQSRSPERLLKLLSKNRGIVADELRFLQGVYSVIETFIELLNEGICATETEITVSEMSGKQIILGEENDFTGEVGFVREFTRFCNELHEPKLNMSFPVGAYWDSMPAFLDEPSRPVRFFSIDPKGSECKASGLYMIGYTRGYYGQTNDLPDRMAAFAKKSGLVFNGPVYNIYLFDEISIIDPEQYLSQVAASVMERRANPRRLRR